VTENESNKEAWGSNGEGSVSEYKANVRIYIIKQAKKDIYTTKYITSFRRITSTKNVVEFTSVPTVF
jgi:Zn/Cd-binding protein ZinT